MRVISVSFAVSLTVRRALPWPPNKLFYIFLQSRYTNLIDGHASLKRSQSAKAKRFSRTIVNNISEVYTWLKSLPGGLGLEKCSRVLESRGLVTLSSLKHLRPGDIDACVVPVPGKIVVGRETRLGKRNQGDDRPGKQNNIAMATGTFSEVQ